MLPAAIWRKQQPDQPYRHESLAQEGFIHCTGDAARLTWVANQFYRREAADFLILWIDEARVVAPVQWDAVGDTAFPHIYGPLNVDAIIDVTAFPRDETGAFLRPSLHGERQP